MIMTCDDDAHPISGHDRFHAPNLMLLAHGTIFAHPRPRDPSRPVSLRRSEASGSASALRGSVLALGIAYDSACLQEATAWLNQHALAAEACHADGYIPSVW